MLLINYNILTIRIPFKIESPDSHETRRAARKEVAGFKAPSKLCSSLRYLGLKGEMSAPAHIINAPQSHSQNAYQYLLPQINFRKNEVLSLSAFERLGVSRDQHRRKSLKYQKTAKAIIKVKLQALTFNYFLGNHYSQPKIALEDA